MTATTNSVPFSPEDVRPEDIRQGAEMLTAILRSSLEDIHNYCEQRFLIQSNEGGPKR